MSGSGRAALALALALARSAQPARAAEPNAFHPAHRVSLTGYAGDAMEPFITRDGRILLFNNRNDPPDKTNLFWAERVDDLTFAFRGPIRGANSPDLDGVPSLDSSGRLYFVSPRSYGRTLSTIYRARFDAGAATDVEVVPGVSAMKPGLVDFDAEISADGDTLYFAEGDFSGPGPHPRGARLWIARRRGAVFVRDTDSDRLLAAVLAHGPAYAPCVSADGLELFFTGPDPARPAAGPRIFRSARTSRTEPFGRPTLVGAASGFVEAPSLSGDGRRLYFHRLDAGRFVVYETWRQDRQGATAGRRSP